MSNFQSEQKKNLTNSLHWQIKSIESTLSDKYADRLSIPLLYTTIGKAEMLCAILSVDHEEEAGKKEEPLGEAAGFPVCAPRAVPSAAVSFD